METIPSISETSLSVFRRKMMFLVGRMIRIRAMATARHDDL